MNKTDSILVVGASGEIGTAIALRLAELGNNLLLHYYTNEKKVIELQNSISKMGREANLIQFNLAQPEEIISQLGAALVKNTITDIVYSAGIIEFGPLGFTKIKAIQNILRTNLEGFFFVTKVVIKDMMHRRKGNIVVIGSIAGNKGFAGQSCYAASKAGLEAAVRSLAIELGPYNIRSNLVAPGLIETTFSSEISERALKEIPLNRSGKPHEVADLVSFLCSDKSLFINGAVIPITGGLSI